MRLFIFLLVVVIAIIVSTSCGKKNAAAIKPRAQDTTQDSVIVIPPSVIYPNTDTFRGKLRVQYLCTMCSCADYDSATDGYYFYVTYISTDSIVFESMDGIYGGPCAWGRKSIRMALKRDVSGSYANSYTHFLLSGDSLHVNWIGDGNSWRSTGGAELDDAYISFQGMLQ